MLVPSLRPIMTSEFELTHVLLVGAAALANSKSGSQERWRLSRDLLAQTARNLDKLSQAADAVERPQQEEHIRSARILRHLSRAAQIAAEML